MFGSNYTPVETVPMLEPGIYTAKIIKAETTNGNYGEQKLVEVTIKDHKGCNPRLFYLNDEPTQGFGSFTVEQAREMWCRNMTQFFDSFKIQRGNFNEKSWVGAVGTVTVRPQKKNPQYMEIVPYEAKQRKPQAENAAAPAAAAPQAAEEFPEDIPF